VCLLAMGVFALLSPAKAEHRSINGAALMPEDVYSNMHDLRGQIVKIRFTPRGQVKQVSPEYYEVRVLPRESDAVVLVPVEIGRKWFAPNTTRNKPNNLLVMIDIGEIENEYGAKKQGLIMIAVGTRTRRGTSYDDVTYEW
jgi:hypothetical protein